MSARAYRARASSWGMPSTMSSSTGSVLHASITHCVPFFSRFDGACTTSGRGLSDGGTGVSGRRSSDGGTTCASGTQRTASYEPRSEEHTSELQSLAYLVCRLLLEKK